MLGQCWHISIRGWNFSRNTMGEVFHIIEHVFTHALLITAFVFVMMLVVEYLNVATRGLWQRRLSASRPKQYLLASSLGATPGCLGAFACTTLRSHRMLSLGAVVACMIATFGDESFYMLAFIPKQALLLLGILFVLGIAVGALTDLLVRKRNLAALAGAGAEGEHCDDLVIHEDEQARLLPTPRGLASTWRHCSLARAVLTVGLTLFLIAVATGRLGPEERAIWITLMAVTGVGLFIVATADEHFLEHHLWQHVARKHLPRLFLWVAGMLMLMVVIDHFEVDEWIETHRFSKYVLLLAACVLGLVPESGPHLIFVRMFQEGLVPFSVLLASSIVQDGHGTLPLLAHSRREFAAVKAVKLVVGLAAGLACMLAGW